MESAKLRRRLLSTTTRLSLEFWHLDSSEKPSFPKLPDRLREDLRNIAPSRDGDLTYLPCAARMRDGTVLQCVNNVIET